MRCVAVALTFAIAILPLISGQSGGALPKPAFDVVSVKPNHSGAYWFTVNSMKDKVGRFAATNISLKGLVTLAYEQDEARILGGPAWLESERYDMEAKVEGQPSGQELLLMLQSLLADRFQLKIHREDREAAQYSLVSERNGPKFGPQFARVENRHCEPDAAPASGCRGLRFSPGSITAENVPVSELARALTAVAGNIVVDRTGLDGRYDFKVEWTRSKDVDSVADSVRAALRDQLGLRLEPRKGPVEMLVIDGAQKPAEN
jgi:uncharacterized protein (TIGR03435 family)